MEQILKHLSYYYIHSVYLLDLLQNSYEYIFCNINEIYYTSYRNKSPIFFFKFMLFFYFLRESYLSVCYDKSLPVFRESFLSQNLV